MIVAPDMSVQDVLEKMAAEGCSNVGVQGDCDSEPVVLSQEQILQALIGQVDTLQQSLRQFQNQLDPSPDSELQHLEQAAVPDLQQKLKQAVKNMSEGLILIDRTGRIELVNTAAKRMLGLDPQTDILTVRKHIDQIGIRSLMANSSQLPAGSGEFRLKSGPGLLLEVRWSSMTDEWEHPLGWVLSIRDVTSEVIAENTKSEFIAAISHELRTPLTSIQNSVSNILAGITGKVSDKLLSYLTAMDKDCHRFGYLVNDLLDITKLEASEMPITRRVVHLGSLVQNVAEEYTSTAQKTDIHLSFNIEPEVCPVYADVQRIRQVMTNLLRNAVQFTPAGGNINIYVHDRGNDVVVEVADTGCGIHPELQKHLFSRFYQCGRRAGAGSRGSGLGLAICKGIISVHGGVIWLESQPEKGSRFFFSLPKIDPDRVLKNRLELFARTCNEQKSRFAMILLSFEMSRKSRLTLRQTAGQIIADMLAQSRFLLNCELDLVLQTGQAEMIFLISESKMQTIECVQNKIEKNLLNQIKKNFSDIPIVPMLGKAVFPADATDTAKLQETVRDNLAEILAG